MVGTLSPGDRLPAGRELAASLDVNLETVQRAYRRLADDGVVISRVGRGTRVSPDLDVARLGLADVIDDLVDRAGRLGLAPAQVLDLVSKRLDQP